MMAIQQQDALFFSQLCKQRHGHEILRRERRHDSDQNDQSGQVQLADKTQKWVTDKQTSVISIRT